MDKEKSKITFGDIQTAAKHTASTHDILNTSLKELSRTFLSYFLEYRKQNELNFEELRSSYIDKFNVESMLKTPDKEQDFYKHICKHYLFIEHNDSRQILHEVVNDVIADLNEVKLDRQKYESQLKKLKEKEFEDGDNYEEKLIIHYIKKQDEAERQILQFITGSLKSYTHKNRYVSPFRQGTLGGIGLRYSYSLNKMAYKKEYLSEIAYKVLHVPVERYFQLEKVYRTDKKKFIKEVGKDIKVDDVLENIKFRVRTNHLLNTRKALITDLLQLFKRKKYELFSNIAPQLIEGILYDYCLEKSIKESSLINSTLVQKIEMLNNIDDYNIKTSYEYFTFKFPIIRNRIAHGKKVKEDLYILSWTLLTDLNYVCNIFKTGDLLTNKKITLIDKAFNDNQLSNLILLSSVIIDPQPDFYKTQIKKFEKLKTKLQNDLTVDNFSKSVTFNKDEERKLLVENIKSLKNVGFNEQECIKILKLLNKKEPDNIIYKIEIIDE
jgi:hypothetical protein